MLNQVILVGRVNKIDKIAGIVSIDIKRPNEKDSDVITVTLTDGLMESVLAYLKKVATTSVKALLNIDKNILRIVGDKVTFIYTKRNK